MLITPEHQQLQEEHRNLALRHYQHEQIVQGKDDIIAELKAQITPLKNANEELIAMVKQQQEQYASLLNIIKEKDKQLQKLELIEHQYKQLQRLLYSSSSEKSFSSIVPGQLMLDMDAEKLEICNINDGVKIESYTKHKSEKQKHPGRNGLPAHIERKYIDIYPENLPEDAVLVDKIETEQLEYDPAKLFATVYRRHKYKLDRPDGSTEFFIATLPEEKDKVLPRHHSKHM